MKFRRWIWLRTNRETKKQRTKKQIEAFENSCEIRIMSAQERKKQKEINDEIKRKEIEERIVKKAFSIKKKK